MRVCFMIGGAADIYTYLYVIPLSNIKALFKKLHSSNKGVGFKRGAFPPTLGVCASTCILLQPIKSHVFPFDVKSQEFIMMMIQGLKLHHLAARLCDDAYNMFWVNCVRPTGFFTKFVGKCALYLLQEKDCKR